MAVVAGVTEAGNTVVASRDKAREKSENLVLRGASCHSKGNHLGVGSGNNCAGI